MIGKISRDFFEKNIINRIGKTREEVVVPPKNGVDVGIVKVGNKYMVLTTDPLYIDKTFGLKKAAWFAFHILLSDMYTSGIRADYMSIDLNLPLSIRDEEFNEIWDVINEESLKYNIEIVTGHTARYANTDYPMLGGVTLVGIGDNYITTENAKINDKIIMTKTCALEASVVLSYTFPQYVKDKLGIDTLSDLNNMFYDMSCIREEELSIDYGIDKITSMHDATEGGLLNSIYEIGIASNNGLLVNMEKIIINDNVKKICELFSINPLRSISEGTLLITVKNEYADEFLNILRENKIESEIIGEIKDKSYGIKIKENDNYYDIKPEDDQFWSAIINGTKDNLK